MSAGQTRRELLTDAARIAVAVSLAPLYDPSERALAEAPPDLAPPGPTFSLPETSLREGDYWAFADWVQGGLEGVWQPREGSYGQDARVNAGMLVTHAVAAMRGHDGPARQDERARLIARRLTESPPYLPGGARSTRRPDQRHTPGFVTTLDSPAGTQHVAIDPEVAEGLVFAWRARGQLSLAPEAVTAIEGVVGRIAAGRFFRYPSVRLNQCNWNCEMYAYAAEVAGREDLLRRDYRRQVTRFLRGSRRRAAPWRIANLSPSYGFHRNPFAPVGARENIESAEYANLVLAFVARYRQAREAGMARLGREELRTLRAWIERALPAYWTHAGYLNWDTGVENRWHTGNYWAFSFDGLLAIASAPAELRDPRLGRWAKGIFDSALRTYMRLALAGSDTASSRIPASPVFSPAPPKLPAHWLFATRFQSQAARAIHAGLGGIAGERPPSLYAFDPSNGRLAITTPHYNTAIVPVSNGAFSYGGIELARLFDGEQRVAACIGAHGQAGFGVTVCHGPAAVLSSQTPRQVAAGGSGPPLRLTRSPRGAVFRGVAYPEHPYAGPFAELRCEGTVRASTLSVRSTYTFTVAGIRVSWSIECDREDDRRGLEATVRFPSWGRDVTVLATDRSGRQHQIGATATPLAGIRRLAIRCDEEGSGYSLAILHAPRRSTLRTLATTPQPDNPRPGPLLILSAARGHDWRSARVEALIVPGAPS